MKKCIGILGGMGPLATAKFLEKIVERTPIKSEQDHIDLIIYSKPSLPDRTAYILDKTKESPVKRMNTYIKELGEKVDLVVIPCMTAMYFYEEIRDGKAVVYFPQVVLAEVIKQGHRRIGILATEGTRVGRVFERCVEQCFKDVGLTIIFPEEKVQEQVMSVIYGIKKGEGVDVERVEYILEEMKAYAPDVILLACTELSLIKGMYPEEVLYVDTLEVLARYTIEWAG